MSEERLSYLELLLVVQLGERLRMGVVAPILSLFIRRQGLTVTQIGYLGTMSVLGWLVFEPLVGLVADRVKKKNLIIFSTVASSFIIVFYPTATNIWHFSLLAFTRTSVLSAYAVSIKAMIAELLPPSSRGKTYGRYMSAVSFGGILGPLLGGYLATLVGYTVPFYLSGVIGAPILGALLMIKYEDKAVEKPSTSEKNSAEGTLKTRPFISILLIRMLYIFNQIFRQNTLPIFLHESEGFKASESEIGIYMGIIQFSSAVSQSFLGSLTDKMGSKMVIAAGLGLSGLSYLGVASLNGILPLYGLGAFQGVSFAAAEIGMMIQCIKSVPEGRTGLAMGIYSEAENIGAIIAAPSYGIIYDSVGPSSSVVTLSITLFFDSILSFILLKNDSKRK